MKRKFLSLDWFLEMLHLKKKEEKIAEEKINNVNEKPYSVIKMVNNVITVVLRDGTVLTRVNATDADFDACTAAETIIEVRDIMEGKEVPKPMKKEEEEYKPTKEEVASVIKGYAVLQTIPEFTIEGKAVYWGVVRRSLPQQLLEAICRLVENQGTPLTMEELKDYEPYQSLKKFWMKCCLNPNAQSAEDLYTFLSNHKFKIDRHGNFYAYRRVVSKSTANKPLAEFVSNTYIKIKAVWKKSPKNFRIVTIPNSDEYKLVDNKFNVTDTEYVCLGDLEFLYKDLPKMTQMTYTSAHTGKEDYRIGEVISMPRHEGDDNNSVSCSKGFHAASKKYDYSGFGDTPILMIINPFDVLSVPRGEVGKLRTCRWFFACVLSEEEKYILDEEAFDVTDLGDTFEEKCMENLSEHIHTICAEEVKRHTFHLPKWEEGEVKRIINSLEEMTAVVKSRVSKFDSDAKG